jgi:hypothetical protein
MAPGRYAPEDFERCGGLTVALVVELLAGGVASIDCGLVGALNSRVAPQLVLAARGLNQPEVDFFHGSLRCVHLRSDGCAFLLEDRPLECALIVPDARECALPEALRMERFWVGQQEVLREAVQERCGVSWLMELHRQLDDRRRNDSKIRGARNLIAARGLAESTADIALIAEMAVMM